MSKEAFDRVWKALSDPSRRAILDLLKEKALTTGEICAHFEMSRFGVMKHMKVLESAALITYRIKGRERVNYLNPVPIQKVLERWISPYQSLWMSSLGRLKEKLENGD